MTGNFFFSSPTADEAILQIEICKSAIRSALLIVGKDLTLRYAERAALSKDADDEALLDSLTGSGKPVAFRSCRMKRPCASSASLNLTLPRVLVASVGAYLHSAQNRRATPRCATDDCKLSCPAIPQSPRTSQ